MPAGPPTRLRRLARAAALCASLLALALIAGCFGGVADGSAGPRPVTISVTTPTSESLKQVASAVPTAPARPQPPRAGQPAWEFALPSLDGDEVALSSLRGRAVMLSFWATWCPPCRNEMPHMVALYDEIGNDAFEILAVNARESPDRVAAFVEEYDMRFPVLLDRAGGVAAAYYVRGIPTSVFVDAEGLVRYVHVGELSESDLRAYVDALLAE